MTEQEFTDVFSEHKDQVFRFAWRLTGSATAAEDITQDCFLTLWRTPSRYDAGRGPLRSFLLGVARNLVLKRWRAEGRLVPIEDDDMVAEQPVDHVAGAEVGATVANAIAALPSPQREVLILAEYEELRLEEIAGIVGVEVTAVKARLHRARTNLRRMLSELRDYARTTK